MKQLEILKKLAKDLKTENHELKTINASLKAKSSEKIKYRLAGKALGHYGFTGLIKAITADGVKVFDVKKVTLIPFNSIETMEKAKPREKRLAAKAIVQPPAKKPATAKSKIDATAILPKKPKKLSSELGTVDDDDDDDDFDEAIIERKSKRSYGNATQNGSKYIPKKR